MTRMTDYGLHAMLPDGEHIYYGYDEKPDVATGKALAICTGGGNTIHTADDTEKT